MNKARLNKESVFLRQATLSDIPKIETLMNRCYRFNEGWTNEADLVGGIRTTQDELQSVIGDGKQYFFVYPKTDTGHRDGSETGEILACINVTVSEDSAYIGMFAVNPELQGTGIGGTMISAAETFAKRHLSGDDKLANPMMKMLVLNGRPKLLAYYERRGYLPTGNTEPFPEDGNNGEPKQQGLYFLELAKPLL